MLQKYVTPRALIMSLLNAPETSILSVGQLIRAGTLFDIEASTLRMAVTRLIKDELITSVDRGIYQAGKKAVKLKEEIESWRTADRKMKPWRGEWLIAITSHLGRTNKAHLRAMKRAFKLYGFAEIEVGVWLRPANLVQGIDQLQEKLVDLGLDSRAHLMTVNSVAGELEKSWPLKWPITELEDGYTKMIRCLKQSVNSLETMNSDKAAKESLIIGESAIRLINLDPLLPAQMIDNSLFQAVVKEMLAYDKIGQIHWQQFLSD